MDFLLDLGATFSVLTEAPGPFFSQFTVWMSQTLFFQSFFQLQQGLCAIFFFLQVSNHAGVSLIPSGEGYAEQGPVLSFHEYGNHSL